MCCPFALQAECSVLSPSLTYLPFLPKGLFDVSEILHDASIHTQKKIQGKTNWGTKTFLYLDGHVTQQKISSLGGEIWHTALPFVSLIIHEK